MTEDEYRRRLARAIVQARADRGMSQAYLAERVHRSEAAVSRWETGKAIPTGYDLHRLAEVLDADAELFVNPPEVGESPVRRFLHPVEVELAEGAADRAVDEARAGRLPGAPRAHRNGDPVPDRQAERHDR